MKIEQQTQRKFLDKDLITYHSNGLSDGKIAKIFGVATQTVGRRRWKLGLLVNKSKFSAGNELNRNEQIKRRKQESKSSTKRYRLKNPEKSKKLQVIYQQNYRKNNPEKYELEKKKIALKLRIKNIN